MKVPSSVTSLSCLSLAHLPSSRNCFSKGVKPECFRLTASEKSPGTYIGDSVALSSLLWLSTSSQLPEGLELHKNGGTNSLCSVYLHRLTHLHVPPNYLSYFGFTQIPYFSENTMYSKEEEVVPSRLSVQEFNVCFKIVRFLLQVFKSICHFCKIIVHYRPCQYVTRFVFHIYQSYVDCILHDA